MRTTKVNGARDSLLKVIERNATLFTVSIIGFILIFGLVVISDPSKWYIGLFGATGFGLFAFTAVHGKVVLKAIASVLFLALIVSFATMAGSLVPTTLLFGLVWGTLQVATYLFCLSLSYMMYSGRSRWLHLGLTTGLQFILVATFLTLGIESYLSLITGTLLSVVFFIFSYKVNKKTRVSIEMPDSGFSKELTKSIFNASNTLGHQARVIPATKKLGAHFLVMKENKAVLLYPVNMEQPFGVIGKRKPQLSYKGKAINPWLLRLSVLTSVAWKTKGASPVLVLVDVNRKNGSEGKLIGASIPDSKKKAIVGIIPVPALKVSSHNYGIKLLESTFSLVDEFNQELTEKQKSKLSMVGLSSNEISDFAEV